MNGTVIISGVYPMLSAMVVTASTGEHLFGLDAQLLFDTAITAVNVLIMTFILSFFLYNPVKKFLEQRKEKISTDLSEAEKAKAEALALKAEYEEKMRGVSAEADEILRDARKRGLDNQARIVEEANAEAGRIRERARKDIELEKQHAVDDVKNYVAELASAIAAKVVSANIDTRVQNDLVEETIRELDENIWQD
ncbi:MAG: F0F1 ATP synthase subunit B [Lachnospiraceae bacterium]|nr:F0F1 ATP synthase subunit B [Lachnospiraceae bacterium]